MSAGGGVGGLSNVSSNRIYTTMIEGLHHNSGLTQMLELPFCTKFKTSS